MITKQQPEVLRNNYCVITKRKKEKKYNVIFVHFRTFSHHGVSTAGSNGAESEGGQNLVDQNNFVYRKARFSPDKSKQFFKCVKCDLLKCKASVWIEVGTLIVYNTAMQEHNHSSPILEMAARYNMF